MIPSVPTRWPANMFSVRCAGALGSGSSAWHGLIGSWLLVFMIFEREYSTGVYLLAPGTEVIGAQLVSLWQGGAIDVVAALSLINIVLVFIGLAFALRFGVKLRD